MINVQRLRAFASVVRIKMNGVLVRDEIFHELHSHRLHWAAHSLSIILFHYRSWDTVVNVIHKFHHRRRFVDGSDGLDAIVRRRTHR